MSWRARVAGFLLERVLRPASRVLPGLRPALLGLSDAALRLSLLPYARSRPVGRVEESPELVARTDQLNRAADRYFVDYPDPQFILGKPFTEPLFAKRLFDMGVLFWVLRLSPGETVAELGAGTCWLSHFLNRHGCRTLAIDVSPAALAMGRELFRRDASTRWELEPEFVAYDGHRLPLPDEICDAIVVNDAFHHIPNQRQILTEMCRILRPYGSVALCEPGMGHSETEESRAEVARTGVLENDIVIENLAELAGECGFAGVNLVPLALPESVELPARELGRFLSGKGFRRFWTRLCDGLEAAHYIVMHKGAPGPTTIRPGRLAAVIRLAGGGRLSAAVARPVRLVARVRNVGDTIWLSRELDRGGWTRLGVHLYELGEAGERLLDFDWFRRELPGDIHPDREVRMELELPALDRPGEYRLVFDLVVEGRTWFAQRGSPTTELRLTVGGDRGEPPSRRR